ncbi:MAG: hypothetical protein ACHQ50_02225 [Fimbriimonadales bacterium]
MRDSKKQLVVVIALAIVVVCVGVFQFAIGGTKPPPPAFLAKKEEKKVQPDVTKDGPPKNLFAVMSLQARDPFEAAALAPDPVKPTQQPAAIQPPVHPQIRGGALPPSEFGGNIPVNVQPLPEEKFSFTLSGVMLGSKPMAVFRDGTGNQRLIMLGGSLDPESNVVSIDKDAVTVRFHGKTLRLTVEGNPNAK